MIIQNINICSHCGRPFFSSTKLDHFQTCIDFNEEIINTNFNDDAYNYFIENKYRAITKESTNNIIYNEYSITNFNFNIESKSSNNNIINKAEKGIENEIKPIINKFNVKDPKRLGRKIKRDVNVNHGDKNKKNNFRVHDKFYDDNIRKKCKNIILKYLFEFINNKLKIEYKYDMGYGDSKKEIKILDQKNNKKSTFDYDREFLGKKLIDIFSQKISGRCCNFSSEHNKKIIESLINEVNEEKRIYFSNLFNLKFLDCLKYFIGDKYFSELEGMKDFSSLKDDIVKENGEDYANHLNYYLKNFEELVNKKPKKFGKK